ncbi:MAG: flagellar FlbD family protein [Chitinispirillaceae bacterium]|nr:flagellar FlbD family protein [Chitinispirillaceae bacterium]
MIALHRLNKQEFVLNADLIETLEATPDTLLTLTTGKKLMVRDTIEDIIGKVIGYRQLCHGAIQVVHAEKRELTGNETDLSDPAGNRRSSGKGSA